MNESEEDEILFEKQNLFKITIDPTITCSQFKAKIVEEYNKRYPENPVTVEKIRLRNPRLDDFGDVIADSSIMENCYLFDDKEIYVQLLDDHTSFELINPH